MSNDWEEKRFKLNQNGGKTVETRAVVPLPPLHERDANRRVDIFDHCTSKDDFSFGEGGVGGAGGQTIASMCYITRSLGLRNTSHLSPCRLLWVLYLWGSMVGLVLQTELQTYRDEGRGV